MNTLFIRENTKAVPLRENMFFFTGKDSGQSNCDSDLGQPSSISGFVSSWQPIPLRI